MSLARHGGNPNSGNPFDMVFNLICIVGLVFFLLYACTGCVVTHTTRDSVTAVVVGQAKVDRCVTVVEPERDPEVVCTEVHGAAISEAGGRVITSLADLVRLLVPGL